MSTSLRGMYCTAAYAASCSVKASRVSATVRPPTDTMTRNGFALIVIGWSGPGTLIGFGVMASIPLVPELARSLLSCLATVDADDLAGEEVRFVGRQEHDGLGDLFGLTCTLRRPARHQAGFPVGIARKAVQHLGFDRTGATALTRTPAAAPSSAATFVSPSTACLLATYIDAPAAPRLPKVDERLMMLPCRWASITRISCFKLRMVPRTLVSKVAA